MLLSLTRFKWTHERSVNGKTIEGSTLGILRVDGEVLFSSNQTGKKENVYILEDEDRDLHSWMSEAEILKQKVKTKTAIPYGKYKVIYTYSPHFKKEMPLIVDVKGFDGIRIHNGSFTKDTDACPLGGYTWFKDQYGNYSVGRSRDWFEDFNSMLHTRIVTLKEDVFIEITK